MEKKKKIIAIVGLGIFAVIFFTVPLALNKSMTLFKYLKMKIPLLFHQKLHTTA